MNGETLDMASAASFLGWSVGMVRSKVARRCLPFKKLSGRILFRREELLRFLDKLEGCTLEEALLNEGRRRGE